LPLLSILYYGYGSIILYLFAQWFFICLLVGSLFICSSVLYSFACHFFICLLVFVMAMVLDDNMCVDCCLVVTDEEEAVQCELCDKWQHRACNSVVTAAQYHNAVVGDGNPNFVCINCNVRDNLQDVQEVVEPEEDSLEDVVPEIFRRTHRHTGPAVCAIIITDAQHL
jgi:hypothetical protein